MRGEVLVAIMNDPRDMAYARDQHWYRIPIQSAERWLRDRWPPQWLAFYQTKIFHGEEHAINYFARVQDIREASRWQLISEQPHDARGQKRYYQLILSPLKRLPRPILSRRRRRIVFIPTTWEKFVKAIEINDLYDESPLEDRLWVELKRLQINAERQEYIAVKNRTYALDFALYCESGKIDVETDGDTWHADPERIPLDNLRDNDLETTGWRVLRFNTYHVQEQLAEYCLPTVVENINRLGGLDEGGLVPRKVALDGSRQMTLFDT